MTNYTNITAESLALIAFDAYYSTELANADLIAAYIADCSATDLDDALMLDISDLLHNANDDDLFPDMTDADSDAINRFLDDDSNFDDMIAALAKIATDRAR